MRILLLGLSLLANVALATGFDANLIGGRQAAPGEYPEVVRIRSGNSACTAAIVGPRVVLTAAHCSTQNGEIVPINQNVLYEFELAQMVFKARCEIAPLYRDNVEDHDMALCLTDRDVDVKYASISSSIPKLAEIITLSGYGCTQPGGGGGNNGILKVGEAPVTRLPSGTNNWFYTKNADGALCFGDSGGPAFKQIKNPKEEHHYIYGVNSRGDIKELSLLTALGLQKSKDFLKAFEAEKGVQICGVSKQCDKPAPEKCQVEKRKLDRAKAAYDACMAKKDGFELDFEL